MELFMDAVGADDLSAVLSQQSLDSFAEAFRERDITLEVLRLMATQEGFAEGMAELGLSAEQAAALAEGVKAAGGAAVGNGVALDEEEDFGDHIFLEVTLEFAGSEDVEALLVDADASDDAGAQLVVEGNTARCLTTPGKRWLLRGKRTGDVLWEGTAAAEPSVQRHTVHVADNPN